VVREGYAQIHAQGETQNEIVDAKRADEALHIFEAAWPTTRQPFGNGFGAVLPGSGPTLRVWSVAKLNCQSSAASADFLSKNHSNATLRNYPNLGNYIVD
jgi:hypothetical protein